MGIDVEFTAKLDADGVVVWEAEGKPAKDHKIFIQPRSRPVDIKFKIASDESAKDLKLGIDLSRPFQVAEDATKCPSEGIDTDQIEVLSCGADNVRIRNSNTGDARTLRYQLNVLDKDGHYHPCDPIIQNGGAGPGNFI